MTIGMGKAQSPTLRKLRDWKRAQRSSGRSEELLRQLPVEGWADESAAFH